MKALELLKEILAELDFSYVFENPKLSNICQRAIEFVENKQPVQYHDIIVRFPTKELADEWCGQMSDGFGEGFCAFNHHRQKPGTDGRKNSDYEQVTEDGKRVYFVDSIFEY
jgi:hypothetical protein